MSNPRRRTLDALSEVSHRGRLNSTSSSYEGEYWKVIDVSWPEGFLPPTIGVRASSTVIVEPLACSRSRATEGSLLWCTFEKCCNKPALTSGARHRGHAASYLTLAVQGPVGSGGQVSHAWRVLKTLLFKCGMAWCGEVLHFGASWVCSQALDVDKAVDCASSNEAYKLQVRTMTVLD